MSAVCGGMIRPSAVTASRPTTPRQVRNMDPQDSRGGRVSIGSLVAHIVSPPVAQARSSLYEALQVVVSGKSRAPPGAAIWRFTEEGLTDVLPNTGRLAKVRPMLCVDAEGARLALTFISE